SFTACCAPDFLAALTTPALACRRSSACACCFARLAPKASRSRDDRCGWSEPPIGPIVTGCSVSASRRAPGWPDKTTTRIHPSRFVQANMAERRRDEQATSVRGLRMVTDVGRVSLVGAGTCQRVGVVVLAGREPAGDQVGLH